MKRWGKSAVLTKYVGRTAAMACIAGEGGAGDVMVATDALTTGRRRF